MKNIDNREVKILIVSEIPEILTSIEKSLEKENYTIYDADNAKSALKIIEDVAINLILLDITIPIKKNFEKSNEDIPIIFLIPKEAIDNIENVYESGAVDFIIKPVNPLEVVRKVKTHVEYNKFKKLLVNKTKELEETKKKLKKFASTDPFAKINNFRVIQLSIENEIHRAVRSNSTFALVIGSINNLKYINDNFGKDYADLIPSEVGEIIIKNTRNQDVFSKWGEEKFLLLLPDTNLAGGLVLAKNLGNKIENKIFLHDDKIKITVTFGVSSYSKGKTADELLKLANKALYKGKEKGGNQVIAGSAMYDL